MSDIEIQARGALGGRGSSSFRRLQWPSTWALLALVGVVACSDGGTEPAPPSNDPAVVDIELSDIQLLVGNEFTLATEVRTATGDVLPSYAPQWVSGSPIIASVDGNGVVRANSPGIAKIFATAGTSLDSVSVAVPTPAGFVTSDGGVVVSSDGRVRLQVNAGAVPDAPLISIIPAKADSLSSAEAPFPNTAYEFGPAGLTFVTAARLSIEYDRSLTTPGEEKRLKLHRLSGSTWTIVEGTAVDTTAATVSGNVTSFSIYAILATPNTAPVATISAPDAGTEIAGGLAADFTGSATDAEDGTLSGASLEWSSSLDGALGTGASISTSSLSIGEHSVTLTATDSEGATGTASVAVSVVDGPPVVQITAPSADTVTKHGDAVVFTGSATDNVEGAIAADSLFWTSSIDGALGTGTSITAASLSLGDHVVTLVARDSGGREGVDSVTVSVKENSPPVVTILAPVQGASIGDRTGATFSGSAIDPEEGALSGTALVWTSSLNGALGTGTAVSGAGLTIGTHTITLTATDSDGATASASVSITVFDEPAALIYPVLTFVSEAGGALTYSVANSASFDNELFTLSGAYPACPPAPTPSRTAVEVYDETGTLLTTFCDFNDRSDMASFTFTPGTPPALVYIELVDRLTGLRIRSTSVAPVPAVPTSIHGVVVNDRDSDLNTLDPGEALSGVTIQLIVDTNMDGIIDAGEPIWATTSTNGSGAYSFTNLWQRNYIVRAISPSNATVLRELSPTGTVVDQTGTLLTTAVVGAGNTLNQSGTVQVGNTNPPGQGDEFPRWGYATGTAAADGGLAPGGPGPNNGNGAVTTAPAHFTFLFTTGGISGSVKNAGVAVQNVRVTITRCQTAPSAPSPPTAGSCTLKHGSPSPHISNADTDASGNYSVSGLMEGVYQVEVIPQTVGMTAVGASVYLAVIRGDGDNAVVPDFSIN